MSGLIKHAIDMFSIVDHIITLQRHYIELELITTRTLREQLTLRALTLALVYRNSNEHHIIK